MDVSGGEMGAGGQGQIGFLVWISGRAFKYSLLKSEHRFDYHFHRYTHTAKQPPAKA
jgi:hypothetical protein